MPAREARGVRIAFVVFGKRVRPGAMAAAVFEAIEDGVPTLVEAREIIAEFHGMIRRRAAGSNALALVLSPHSPAALRKMKRRLGRQSRRPGPTGRPKGRSPA